MPDRAPEYSRSGSGHRRGGGRLFYGERPMPRESVAALGWALTATTWLLAGLMMLSVVAGECGTTTGVACPRGGHAIALLWIAAGALALNALVVGLIAYLRRR